MAKSNSFNKREIEKKKASKRQEKQQKREERKASGTDSFDDMIAYVDENGVITDTPPDLRPKEKIEIEDILISTPKKSEIEENVILRGRVEFFDTTKGFGFIKDLNSVDKYFFHKSNILDDLTENNIVTFDLERGPKGMNAVNVRLEK